VKLEPWGRGIYPHEATFSKAKSDRLQLMRVCRANFSPLFSLYQGSGQEIALKLSEVARGKPIIETSVSSPSTGEGAGAHILWAITDPETKREISQLLSSQPLYIADGHHRYETALNYRQERAQEQSAFLDSSVIASEAKQSLTGKEAFQYVMMELVDFSDPGLVVLPVHRLVRGIALSILAGLGEQLRRFFVLESVPLKADTCHMPSGSCLGVLGLEPSSLVVLKKLQGVSFANMMPSDRSQAYREFGGSILNHVILDGVLSEAKDLDVAYTADLEAVCQQIKEGQYQLAFLLNPPQPEMVKAVADAQDRMPGKSTYFYPKLPTGLVINPLE